MTKDEALDKALDTLEGMHIDEFSLENLADWNKAIAAIKQARSAPVQPSIKQGWDVDTLLDKPAAQRQWVGLDFSEVDELAREMIKGNKSVNWLAFSIDAKLKEKNGM